jgi:4-amino-4-deoxy-L-arabinose transferase-like glycosyltransferase
MDWLYEGVTAVYLLLAALAALLLWGWWRDRKIASLLGLLVIALAAGAYLALDWLVETRGEQISRRIRELAAAVSRKDARALLTHLSPTQFRHLKKGPEAFLARVDALWQDGWFDSVTVWDIRPGPPGSPTLLSAKPRGGVAPSVPFLVRAHWHEERPGAWLLSSFSVHKTFADSDAPLDLPHFEQED